MASIQSVITPNDQLNNDGGDSPAAICRDVNLEVFVVGNKAVYLTPGRANGQPTMVLYKMTKL